MKNRAAGFKTSELKKKLVSFLSLYFQGRIAMGGLPHGGVWVPCTKKDL
jgi:hypothetical protein